MTTELKTDSWHRYTLYRRDVYMRSMFDDATKQAAIEAGRKYTLAAYADVWAKDAALVDRVRLFLGTNFPWHERLARCGSDLEVLQMLQSMVRSNGSAVVVIPENLQRSAGTGSASAKKSASSFWGRDDYDAELMVGTAERYRAQLERINAEGPSWAEIRAQMDDMNTTFMHALVLKDPLTMLPLFAQAGWVSKYGLPDLSSYDGDDTFGAECFTDNDTATILSDGKAFEYSEDRLPGEATDLAGIPFNGVPNTWVENEPGKKMQWRMYGSDGTPSVDVDFDSHHGQPNPHAHNWDDQGRDHGWPVSILP